MNGRDLREQRALTDLVNEMARARGLHANMVSAHQAIAVIREEYLEAEREVFTKYINHGAVRRELLHTAGVCLRAIVDLRLDSTAEVHDFQEPFGDVISSMVGILQHPESGSNHE